MFWGREIEGRQFEEIGGYDGETIHLTGACICNDVPNDSKTYLRVKVNAKTYAIACLSNNTPQVKLDLYLSCTDDLALIVDGHHKLSIVGLMEESEPDEMNSDEEEAECLAEMRESMSAEEIERLAKAKGVEDGHISDEDNADDDDDSVDEDLDSEEEEEISPEALAALRAAQADENDDDEDDDEEEEDDEEDEAEEEEMTPEEEAMMKKFMSKQK